MPIPLMLAGLASIGEAAGGATAAGIGAGAVAGGTTAGGLAAGAGGAATVGSTLAPAVNAAAAGNGLAGASGLMGGGAAHGFTPSLTYSAAMGNPVAGSVPLQAMKPIQDVAYQGVMQNGTNGLFSGMSLDKLKSAGNAVGGMSPAPQSHLQPPQITPGARQPFQPFVFDPRNYQFRRPIGY